MLTEPKSDTVTLLVLAATIVLYGLGRLPFEDAAVVLLAAIAVLVAQLRYFVHHDHSTPASTTEPEADTDD